MTIWFSLSRNPTTTFQKVLNDFYKGPDRSVGSGILSPSRASGVMVVKPFRSKQGNHSSYGSQGGLQSHPLQSHWVLASSSYVEGPIYSRVNLGYRYPSTAFGDIFRALRTVTQSLSCVEICKQTRQNGSFNHCKKCGA